MVQPNQILIVLCVVVKNVVRKIQNVNVLKTLIGAIGVESVILNLQNIKGSVIVGCVYLVIIIKTKPNGIIIKKKPNGNYVNPHGLKR
jgi:hypothetical protein